MGAIEHNTKTNIYAAEERYCHVFALLTVTQTPKDFKKAWPKLKHYNRLEKLLGCPFHYSHPVCGSFCKESWELSKGWAERARSERLDAAKKESRLIALAAKEAARANHRGRGLERKSCKGR